MKYPHGIYTEPCINELLLKDQIIEKDAPRLTHKLSNLTFIHGIHEWIPDATRTDTIKIHGVSLPNTDP